MLTIIKTYNENVKKRKKKEKANILWLQKQPI